MLPPIYRKALMKTYKNTTDSPIEVFTTGRNFQRIPPRGKHSFADGEDGNCHALVAKGYLRLIPEESPPDYLDVVMASLRKELEAFLPKICEAVVKTLKGESPESLNGTLAEMGNRIYSYVPEPEATEMVKEIPVEVTPIEQVVLPPVGEEIFVLCPSCSREVVQTPEHSCPVCGYMFDLPEAEEEIPSTEETIEAPATEDAGIPEENPVSSTEETSGKRGRRKHR